MGDLADRAASSLSTGRQRLLDVARAVAADPAVMLLDEPAAGLDDAETAALGELIVRISRAGTAVLLVEHAMGLVMSIADHVVVLDQGRKIAEGPPGVVGRDERVVEAYLGTAIA
jgi:ABC-type branched-subunit amino acid transport system ATPase component